ncbi:unnamed protein product [Ambrosiozyma monospora]|uniref:Unnamed protein product n=1 Tax=Ambrosiozyma monospora TaxID=43982 RepID=A0ACB5UAA7_AMBMO|nr:unnamed protein product [Ambrosiozyma monospora]
MLEPFYCTLQSIDELFKWNKIITENSLKFDENVVGPMFKFLSESETQLSHEAFVSIMKDVVSYGGLEVLKKDRYVLDEFTRLALFYRKEELGDPNQDPKKIDLLVGDFKILFSFLESGDAYTANSDKLDSLEDAIMSVANVQ